MQESLTLINPQTGHLGFKIYDFESNHTFDHIQRHNYFSIIWVKTGKGKLKADFSEYDFEAGSMWFFSPYQPFMLKTEEAVQGTILHFHPDFFCIIKHQKEVACNGVLFNNIYQTPSLHISENEQSNFENVIAQMRVEMQNPALAQYELLIAYLKIFLINATRLKINQQPEIQVDIEIKGEPFILQNLKDSIEEHYKIKRAPSDYANMLNITLNALAKITKKYFNKTLTDLIAERVIMEAKRELYLTNKTIKMIAYELGFQDEYYFSRFFKNNTEVSPQLYRETVGFNRMEG